MSSQQLLSFPNQILVSSEIEGWEQVGTQAVCSPPETGTLWSGGNTQGSQRLAVLWGGGTHHLRCQVLGVTSLFSGIVTIFCLNFHAFNELVAATCIWLSFIMCCCYRAKNLAIALVFFFLWLASQKSNLLHPLISGALALGCESAKVWVSLGLFCTVTESEISFFLLPFLIYSQLMDCGQRSNYLQGGKSSTYFPFGRSTELSF